MTTEMPKFRIQKQKGKYYIQKKFFFWWHKVPDTGLGWGRKELAFISGTEHKKVCERIMNTFYSKKESEI